MVRRNVCKRFLSVKNISKSKLDKGMLKRLYISSTSLKLRLIRRQRTINIKYKSSFWYDVIEYRGKPLLVVDFQHVCKFYEPKTYYDENVFETRFLPVAIFVMNKISTL